MKADANRKANKFGCQTIIVYVIVATAGIKLYISV